MKRQMKQGLERGSLGVCTRIEEENEKGMVKGKMGGKGIQEVERGNMGVCTRIEER